jgi:hypothetical protein
MKTRIQTRFPVVARQLRSIVPHILGRAGIGGEIINEFGICGNSRAGIHARRSAIGDGRPHLHVHNVGVQPSNVGKVTLVQTAPTRYSFMRSCYRVMAS